VGVNYTYTVLYIDSGQKQMYGLFFPASKKAAVYVVDTVRTNQMPNMTNVYNAEYAAKLVVSLLLCSVYITSSHASICGNSSDGEAKIVYLHLFQDVVFLHVHNKLYLVFAAFYLKVDGHLAHLAHDSG